MKYLVDYDNFYGIKESNQTEPLDPYKLSSINPNRELFSKTNQTLLKGLDGGGYKIPQELKNPNDPKFLSKVSDWLEKQGISPFLSLNLDEKTGKVNHSSPGVCWSIPKTNIRVNLQNGYFGINLKLPKGIELGLESHPKTRKPVPNINLGDTGSLDDESTISTRLIIPIGKR